MKHGPELAAGTAVMAAIAIILLGVSTNFMWFEWDHSTGRQTPPDGPYNQGEDGVIRQHWEIHATHWEGDIEPGDEGLADTLNLVAPVLMGVTAGTLVLASLGEIPAVHRFIPRRVAIGLIAVSLVAITALVAFSWVALPLTMAEFGAESQFTARLDEDSGYTSTNLGWGWYALTLSILPIVGAGLFKFQAGHHDVGAMDWFQRHQNDAEES